MLQPKIIWSHWQIQKRNMPEVWSTILVQRIPSHLMDNLFLDPYRMDRKLPKVRFSKIKYHICDVSSKTIQNTRGLVWSTEYLLVLNFRFHSCSSVVLWIDNLFYHRFQRSRLLRGHIECIPLWSWQSSIYYVYRVCVDGVLFMQTLVSRSRSMVLQPLNKQPKHDRYRTPRDRKKHQNFIK